MCQHNAAFYSAFFALLIAFVDIIPYLQQFGKTDFGDSGLWEGI